MDINGQKSLAVFQNRCFQDFSLKLQKLKRKRFECSFFIELIGRSLQIGLADLTNT